MKLYTINATPVQSLQQMIRNGYDITEENSVEHINKLHLEEYPVTVAKVLKSFGVDGFTLVPVQGYWEGIPEDSFEIKIAMDDETNPGGADADATAEMIAQELATVYNQDAVMLTLPNNTVKFIEQ